MPGSIGPTPEKLAASGTEHGAQTALFAWAALNRERWPELDWMFAIPNGGIRGSTKRERMIRGSALKAEGVRPGVADIFVPIPRNGVSGLFIEMKRPGKNARSPEQKAFQAAMWERGYRHAFCEGFEQARDTLIAHLESTK